ncbi:hypothetical protein [Shewanella aestuarii]|uniref:Uncharacterized protein n=1 Tax=Shewanella aestuarii TaxID=1028752 RepID=A0A6G9QRK2_9GAMM|nr:hypothetical protein [Shewanella aestuarii]QIR16431.1 hypothetical protein HBH39_18335 [Shewanella aestuarii]
MIEKSKHYYRTMLESQKCFLMACYKLVTAHPLSCRSAFNMNDDVLQFISSIGESEFSDLCDNLNYWILSPISRPSESWSDPDECFFIKWIDSLESSCKFLNDVESENLKNCLESEQEPLLRNVLNAQSALLFCVGDLTLSDAGFASLVLGINKKHLNRLKDNWFNPNKFVSISELPPIFRINPNLKFNELRTFHNKANDLVIENALFSFMPI